jgi:hypothetical protein
LGWLWSENQKGRRDDPDGLVRAPPTLCCSYVGGSESRRAEWLVVTGVRPKPPLSARSRHEEPAMAMAHGRAAPATWAGYWARIVRFIVVVVLSAAAREGGWPEVRLVPFGKRTTRAPIGQPEITSR